MKAHLDEFTKGDMLVSLNHQYKKTFNDIIEIKNMVNHEVQPMMAELKRQQKTLTPMLDELKTMNSEISKKMEAFTAAQRNAQTTIQQLEVEHQKNITAFNLKVEELNKRIDENE